MSDTIEHNLFIDADGRIRFIWDDALEPVCRDGLATVRRVGEVEPSEGGSWMVDLSRAGGGVYGPYPLRDTALFHERAVVTGLLMAGMLD